MTVTILFTMYSKAHEEIIDTENDYTVRELCFAHELRKRIVFIEIEVSNLPYWFIFKFSPKAGDICQRQSWDEQTGLRHSQMASFITTKPLILRVNTRLKLVYYLIMGRILRPESRMLHQ